MECGKSYIYLCKYNIRTIIKAVRSAKLDMIDNDNFNLRLLFIFLNFSNAITFSANLMISGRKEAMAGKALMRFNK
jgi:hypothetical protein